jgi:alkylhydroperoxidase family enzyme
VLARLAVTLTARPWEFTREMVADAAEQGMDEGQIEAAIGVIAMFNYFTRVADAAGIEFDYDTPLPAFEPDRGQVTATRPGRSVAARLDAGPDAGHRPQPFYPQLREIWETWRTYVTESDEPLSRRDRRILARVAAEEATDWAFAETLDEPARDGDEQLAGFARKLSREPWRMVAGDLDTLRAAGYSEQAVLHIISVVAHQNADSRLVIGLRASRT